MGREIAVRSVDDHAGAPARLRADSKVDAPRTEVRLDDNVAGTHRSLGLVEDVRLVFPPGKIRMCERAPANPPPVVRGLDRRIHHLLEVLRVAKDVGDNDGLQGSEPFDDGIDAREPFRVV